MKNLNFCLLVSIVALSGVVSSAFAEPLLTLGNVGTGEYKLPASVIKDVLEDRETELWAQVYYPKKNITQPLPLAIFLHGNHETCGAGENPRYDDSCQYTDSGTCPSGYVITPNHLGYTYLAEQLVNEGMIVVSINANRGINCSNNGPDSDWGLNLARGRLVLKHLETLSLWTKNGGTPSTVGLDFKNAIDFSRVAMMGHSRGGEGVRAAYNQYLEAGSVWPGKILSPLNVRGIFEIGPVDGQTNVVLDAFNTSWNVLLPMCDGDVSDLEGMNPLDRMLNFNRETRGASKSALVVWGTNHNFYNTEWQISDSNGCFNHEALWSKKDGEALQRETAKMTLVPFFKAKLLGETQNFVQVFDPLNPLPAEISDITRIDRTYVETVEAAWLKMVSLSLSGSEKMSKVTKVSGTIESHPSRMKGFTLSWNSSGSDVFYEFQLAGGSFDLTEYNVFSLRLNRADYESSEKTPIDFSVQLRDAFGNGSTMLNVSHYVDLIPTADHALMMSLRIPVGDFIGKYDLTKVVSVRLVFNKSNKGHLYVAQPTLQKMGFTEDLNSLLNVASPEPTPMAQLRRDRLIQKVMPIRAKLRVQSGRKQTTRVLGDSVELRTGERFRVRDALPVLSIGSREYKSSHFPRNGKTDVLIFDVGQDSKHRHRADDEVRFYYRGGPDLLIYSAGTFKDIF